MLRPVLASFVSALLGVGPCLAQASRSPQADSQARYHQIVATARQRMMNQYQTQAEHGDMNAAMKLGTMYFRGQEIIKVGPDYVQARKWFVYAAEGGNPFAGEALASMYWEGLGGPMDKDRANYILLWAAPKGNTSALRTHELRGFDMRVERAKADEQARAYEERRKAAAGNVEAAEGGAAILFGLMMMNAASNGSRPGEDPRCQAWRQPQFFGMPAGATLPPGFSPASCH